MKYWNDFTKVEKFWLAAAMSIALVSMFSIALYAFAPVPITNNMAAVLQAPVAVKGAAFPATTVVKGCAPCAVLTAQEIEGTTVLQFAARDADSFPVKGLEISFHIFEQEVVMTTGEDGKVEAAFARPLGVDPYTLQSLSPFINGEEAVRNERKLHGFIMEFKLP